MPNRNIYTVEEGKSKDTKLRRLKGTNEDISKSQEIEFQRYKAEWSQKIQRNPSQTVHR